ncbi:MAG: isoprenylcysteine carboxylmethyltransferase family protein [Bacteroidales bacterium]|nr:isoprenylcysteine carboxylmethyltransferase family protein [Bacteroidales bacterium]
MLRKLLIAPVFMLLSFTGIVFFYFALPAYNLIPFPFNLAGVIVAFGGFVVMGKSYDIFGKHSIKPSEDCPPVLITKGIYCRTRNPMYLGMFILLFGFSFAFRNIASMAMALLFLLGVNFIIIPREEKDLRAFFGEQFDLYRQQVSRWYNPL